MHGGALYCHRAAAVRDRLGRSVKKSLRAQLYAKFLRLGVRETKTVKPAGLTQLATEGIEQLDLYYSSYLPQFFCAMLSLGASRCSATRRSISRRSSTH